MVRGVTAIVAAWLLLIATLFLFQRSGSSIGLNVWWLGEARDWIMYLQDGGVSHTANVFWQIDGRNPLLAWWYVALRSFILTHRAAFLELHLVSTLVLALSEYLLVVSITNGRQKALALAVGLTTATFISGSRVDNVNWVLTAILACSLLSVLCFSEFLRSKRTQCLWLTTSIVLWMIAVQSYSIQSGAVFSIFALSLFNPARPVTVREFGRRIGVAIIDVAPYLALFAMFVLFWRTVAPDNRATTAVFDIWRMIASLRQAIWNDNEFLTIRVEIGYLGTTLPIIVFSIAALVFSAIQIAATRDRPRTTTLDLFKIFAVSAGIALPTLLVESSGADYFAGSRWMLLEQFWIPTVLCCAIALLLMPLPSVLARIMWIAGTSVVAAYGFLATLAFTSLVHNISVYEEVFMNDFRRLVSEDRQSGATFPRAYLILDSSPNWSPSDWVDLPYAKSEGIPDVRFRFIRAGPPAPNPLTFTDNAVENPQTNWLPKPTPYDRVSLVSWDGVRFKQIRSADAETFKGKDAVWKRSTPLSGLGAP